MKRSKKTYGLLTGLLAAITVFLITSEALALSFPLPYESSHIDTTSANLSSFRFSTDIREVGKQPSAYGKEPYLPVGCTMSSAQPDVRVFLSDPKECINPGNTATYNLTVTNMSDQPVFNLTAGIVPPPEGSIISSSVPFPFIGTPITDSSNEFNVGLYELSGKQEVEYSFELTTPKEAGNFTTGVIVDYYTCNDRHQRHQCIENCLKTKDAASCEHSCGNSHQTATQHTLETKDCSAPRVLAWPEPSKKPAIICHPADKSCRPSTPDLGVNFKNAKPWLDNPQLGIRFQEAISDIIPGECKVADDAIVRYDKAPHVPPYTPEGFWRWHDAIDRQGQPAAAFMEPLYNSGNDFRRIAHENELLGIQNKMYAKNKLSEITDKFWLKMEGEIEDILAEKKETDYLRNNTRRMIEEFQNESRQAQVELKQQYQKMQQQRVKKFGPIAQKAVANAIEAIRRICPPPPHDGGLSQLLPTVELVYSNALFERMLEYDKTQELFAKFEIEDNPNYYGPSKWVPLLMQALDAFDAGNPEPLSTFMQIGPDGKPWNRTKGFEMIWEASYGKHAKDDKAKDEEVRVKHWEIALDKPKEAVGFCALEALFKGPVETTYCESNSYYPEVLTQRPSRNVKNITPPVSLPAGGEAIDETLTRGRPCGRRPGDPYWADDCSCNCDDPIIVNIDDGDGDGGGGSSSPGDTMQNVLGITSSLSGFMLPDIAKENLEQNRGIMRCGDLRPITRHDINVTSQLECMRDPKHVNSSF